MNEQLEKCIEECLACLKECNHCYDACLKEENVQHLTDCLRLTRECAEICGYALTAMSL